MTGWSPDPQLPHCGRLPDVPPPFRAAFTLRPGSIVHPGGERQPDYAGLAATLGLTPASLVRVRQVHGAVVLRADRPHPDETVGPGGIRLLPAADGLVSGEADQVLVGLSADCPVLLLADPVTGAVGMAHSGWRGTAAGIGVALVERLAHLYGSRPADLRAWICPGIGPCCYEVGEEVFAGLAAQLPDVAVRVAGAGARDHLDLIRANRAVLATAGLAETAIRDVALCTSCHPELLFSYRREGPGYGQFAGLIGRLA